MPQVYKIDRTSSHRGFLLGSFHLGDRRKDIEQMSDAPTSVPYVFFVCVTPPNIISVLQDIGHDMRWLQELPVTRSVFLGPATEESPG